MPIRLEKNKSVLCDMDGVIIWDNKLIEGAKEFVDSLLERKTPFLFITNYPSLTPADLGAKNFKELARK